MPAEGFQVLTAPVEIPTVIPDIDLSRKATDEADFSGRGVAGGVAGGVVGGKVMPYEELERGAEQPSFEFQVEKSVARLPGPAPRYPEHLRAENVEGEVFAQFVVDTLGRVEDGSFEALKSTHVLFTMAVQAALPQQRFRPAEIGGRRVRTLVQQPFLFKLAQGG